MLILRKIIFLINNFYFFLKKKETITKQNKKINQAMKRKIETIEEKKELENPTKIQKNETEEKNSTLISCVVCLNSKKIQKNETEEKNSTLISCVVCLNSKPIGKTLLHCEALQKTWCEDCTTDYLWIKIMENEFVFHCHQCKELIPLENVENFLMDDSKQHPKKQQLMSKLSFEIYKSQLERWGFNIFYCPIPNCNGTFTFTNQTLEEISFTDCSTCKKRICLHCKEEYHHDFTCAQRQQWLKLNDEEAKKTAEYKEKNVKQCPTCKIEIEKAYGCDHVTCASCKFEFCFICGKQYKEGHLREHWVRNDPEAINGLLMQHLQLAQMGYY